MPRHILPGTLFELLELSVQVRWLEAEHAGKEVIFENKLHQLETRIGNAQRERDVIKVRPPSLSRLSREGLRNAAACSRTRVYASFVLGRGCKSNN